jgi:hypothetical protein
MTYTASAAERYLEMLRTWDARAVEGRFADDWLDDIGMAVEQYLVRCVKEEITPTFLGFWLYLCEIAPQEAQP